MTRQEAQNILFQNESIELNYPILKEKGQFHYKEEIKDDKSYFIVAYQYLGYIVAYGKILKEYKALYDNESIILNDVLIFSEEN